MASGGLGLEDSSCRRRVVDTVIAEQVAGVVGGNEWARLRVSVEKGEAALVSELTHQFGIISGDNGGDAALKVTSSGSDFVIGDMAEAVQFAEFVDEVDCSVT